MMDSYSPPWFHFDASAIAEALAGWPRATLVLLAVAISAFVVYKDFEKLEVPDWITYPFLLLMAVFWVAALPDVFDLYGRGLGLVNVLSAFIALAALVSVVTTPLVLLASPFNVGEGDALYAGLLAALLPSPTLWGSPFPFVQSVFGATPIDYIVNVALAFIVTGVITKVYVRVRGEFGVVPFTPVVGVVFVTTVLFGAWWHPVVEPVWRAFVAIL